MSEDSLYSAEEVRKIYEAVRDHVKTRRLISRYSRNRQDIRESALMGLDLTGVGDVLDLGCAYGFFTEKLAGRLKGGAAVTGLDLAGEANREAFLRIVDSMGYRGRFVAGSADLIGDMDDGSFDLVVASYSLYFFPHLVGQIARVLRPDGVFIAITHAEASLQEVIRLIPECIRSAGVEPPAEPAIGRLLRRFSLENGEGQLRGHFGRIERIPFENDLSFPRENIEDCVDYLSKKQHLLFKEVLDAEPERVDEALSCFYRELRESARREGKVVITKDDCIFRCFDPGGEARGAVKKGRSFCCHCGEALNRRKIDGKARDWCPRCDTVFYENPLPVASAIVVNGKRELLLVKRGHEPYRGMWCLPIGFAESGERVRDAALRELREETGLEGEIVRLIDVSTVDDAYYGDMAVITYEVRRTGGKLAAGDDAANARYVPIHELPPLAWEANRAAVDRYLALYRDAWAMTDSYRHLFSDVEEADIPAVERQEEKTFLSDVLVRTIDRYQDEIAGHWKADVRKIVPDIVPQMRLISGIHTHALGEVRNLLRGRGDLFDAGWFVKAGTRLRERAVPLPSILGAMALSRKAIWAQVMKRRVLGSPIQIYTTLELNNRIVFLYDRMDYHLAAGWSRDREQAGG